METKHQTMELEGALSSFENAVMSNWGKDLLEATSERLQRHLVEAEYTLTPRSARTMTIGTENSISQRVPLKSCSCTNYGQMSHLWPWKR